MTAVSVYFLKCDWPDCDNQFRITVEPQKYTGPINKAIIRRSASFSGWTLLYRRDYCPRHKKDCA